MGNRRNEVITIIPLAGSRLEEKTKEEIDRNRNIVLSHETARQRVISREVAQFATEIFNQRINVNLALGTPGTYRATLIPTKTLISSEDFTNNLENLMYGNGYLIRWEETI
jgi:hypothetical protein